MKVIKDKVHVQKVKLHEAQRVRDQHIQHQIAVSKKNSRIMQNAFLSKNTMNKQMNDCEVCRPAGTNPLLLSVHFNHQAESGKAP